MNDDMTTQSDIVTNGWIEKILPRALRPYAYLARLDRSIGSWLLFLPGVWSILLAAGGLTGLNGQDIYLLSLFAIGAIIMRAAGCIINDLWDRDLDTKVARTRTRPLASGDLTPRQALVFLGLLLLTGLVILLQLHFTTILLGLLAIILVVVYPLMTVRTI